MSSPDVAALRSLAGSGTLQLLGNELATQFRRWRTWAMLAALALIPILLGIAVRLVGGSRPGRRCDRRRGRPRHAPLPADRPRRARAPAVGEVPLRGGLLPGRHPHLGC